MARVSLESRLERVDIRPLRGYDAGELSRETGLDTGDFTYTQQHLAEEADVNVIVRRFGLTGRIPQDVREGVYGDFSGIEDYQGALDMIRTAEASFMSLPPEVRERFNNDPGELVLQAQILPEEEFFERLGVKQKVSQEPVKPVPDPATPVAGAGGAV